MLGARQTLRPERESALFSLAAFALCGTRVVPARRVKRRPKR